MFKKNIQFNLTNILHFKVKAGSVLNVVGVLACLFSVHVFGPATFGTNDPCPAFMNSTACGTATNIILNGNLTTMGLNDSILNATTMALNGGN